MKSVSVIAILLITGSLLFAQDVSHIYASKSGQIKYQYEYAGVTTEYTIIFDDYGQKQVFDLQGKSGGMSEHSRTIINPDAMYIVNYEDKQIIKFPIDTDSESLDEYGGNAAGGIDLQEMVAKVKQSAGGIKGKETVSGKDCDVFEYADSDDGFKGKYWIWNGFLMRAEFLDAHGEHTFMRVKDISLDVPIEASAFEIPSGFEVTDMSQMMEQMKQLQQLYGVPDDGGE